MTERKNNSDIIEIKNPKIEEVIRRDCGKPTEPLTWGDFRSCKGLIAFMAKGILGCDRMEYSPDFDKLNAALRKKMLEHTDLTDEDSWSWKLYVNMHAHANPHYSNVFGLGMILGASDFWDIGCGTGMQVGQIMVWKGIRYTGIDYITEQEHLHTKLSPEGEIIEEWVESIPFTVEEYNDVFASVGGRIRFRQAEYPCPVDPGKHSIAVCLGWDFKPPQKFAKALTADFDRVILQYSLAEEAEWKNALSSFTLSPLYGWDKTNYFTGKVLGGWRVVLATKFPEDIDYLRNIGYDWYNPRFQLGSFELAQYLDRFYENIDR